MSISKELKRKVFEAAATNFETTDVKAYFLEMSEFVPDYFFTIPASTSGKYHSKQQCAPCGEIIHAYMIQACWDMLLSLDSIREEFAKDEHTRDVIRCFAFLHDALKCGTVGGKYTVPDHPKLAATFIHETHPEHDLRVEDKQLLAGMVSTHSGQWNTNRSGQVIMPTPRTLVEKFGHYTDMFCSRKCFIYELTDDQQKVVAEIIKSSDDTQIKSYSETNNFNTTEVEPCEMILYFGKYNGMKLKDIIKDPKGKDYLVWITKNFTDKPALVNAINTLLK